MIKNFKEFFESFKPKNLDDRYKSKIGTKFQKKREKLLKKVSVERLIDMFNQINKDIEETPWDGDERYPKEEPTPLTDVDYYTDQILYMHEDIGMDRGTARLLATEMAERVKAKK